MIFALSEGLGDQRFTYEAVAQTPSAQSVVPLYSHDCREVETSPETGKIHKGCSQLRVTTTPTFRLIRAPEKPLGYTAHKVRVMATPG